MEFTKTVDMEENNRNWYWNSLENENVCMYYVCIHTFIREWN